MTLQSSFIEKHVRFSTVSLKALSNQECMWFKSYSLENLIIFNFDFSIVTCAFLLQAAAAINRVFFNYNCSKRGGAIRYFVTPNFVQAAFSPKTWVRRLKFCKQPQILVIYIDHEFDLQRYLIFWGHDLQNHLRSKMVSEWNQNTKKPMIWYLTWPIYIDLIFWPF